MPILRKNGATLYFAHQPKTAGSSLYSILLENDWQISNFGRKSGDLGTSGTALEIREKYDVPSVPKEGNLDAVETSLQHVPAKIWQNWGPFDASFIIVRDPIKRFTSSYFYQYQTALRESGVSHTPAILEEFDGIFMSVLENELRDKPFLADGHFLPTLDFITNDTHLYLLEHGGFDALMRDLQLQGALPHKKKAALKLPLGDRQLAFAQEFYAKDIEWYDMIIAQFKNQKSK